MEEVVKEAKNLPFFQKFDRFLGFFVVPILLSLLAN